MRVACLLVTHLRAKMEMYRHRHSYLKDAPVTIVDRSPSGIRPTGRVSRWDGTTNVIATDLRAVPSGISMPPSHDWH